MSRPNSQFYLSPDQQDLLMAALNSNQPVNQQSRSISGSNSSAPKRSSSINSSTNMYDSPVQQTPSSGQLDFGLEESPYLDFDGDYDDSYNFDINGQDLNGQMIGDIPTSRSSSTEQADNDLHDKRKNVDGKTDDDQGDPKRREGEDKAAKKPGRKPLTSEPTSKRKAQNRAAQRAFRDRKEKHLKDLETKVESLEKASESANHENGLLRAQVERLQVELKEYRKRLSWVSNSGFARNAGGSNSAPNPPAPARSQNSNDFQFEFPKFGDLPVSAFNSNGSLAKAGDAMNRSSSARKPSQPNGKVQASNAGVSSQGSTPSQVSATNSPAASVRQTTSPSGQNGSQQKSASYDNFTALFSPSTLEASRNFEYFPRTAAAVNGNRGSTDSTNGVNGQHNAAYTNSSASNTDSPSGSSDSQRAASSIGTSPEPSLSSPSGSKLNEFGLNTINEESQYPKNMAFGTNVPTEADFNWLVQQNGGNFDPVLFGDYREPQEAILGQDFGSFFNDAFPLPDLGSPLHNFNEVTTPATQVPPKVDLMKQIEAVQNGEEDTSVSSAERAKMMTCNKIWDRLQSMEKFRNGEIDVDNLCSELRAKARCSEGGAVVDQKDVEKILGSAK